MYYKNPKNELFFEPSTGVVNKHQLSEISETEFNQILEAQNRFVPDWDNEGRHKRDDLLKETDWAILPDSPFAGSQSLKDYRQALRDLPALYPNYMDVVWPVKPVA